MFSGTIGNNFVRPENSPASHKCGNSICVEPKHLYFGTAQQNTLDKHKHGTMHSKLKAQDVLEIRRLSKEEKMSAGMIATKFPVSVHQIKKILSGESWAHLK